MASWNHSTHFCDWYGITCNRRHQRVQSLLLEDHSLRGFLSPYIGNLSFLRAISLLNNSFYREIPQDLGRLFRLQNLRLTHNTLVGEIPVNITSCSQLRYLDFGENHLNGRIPKEIGSLHNLEILSLEKNNLTGQIPYSMWNLSSITVISLGANNFEGSIAKEIGLLKNLTKLGLGPNNFLGTLPSSLYNLSFLQVLSIASNYFIGTLPPNIFLPKLEIFEIGGNQISGPVPTSTTNATTLQIFDIGENSLTGQVPILDRLQHLWWLDFSENNLGDNSAKDLEFLNSLTNCSKLHVFTMWSNNFGGPLPNSIGNLSTELQQLYLGDNKIFGNIPESIGNLNNLIVLVMGNNHLTHVIPTTFGKFWRMQSLHLNGNKLSGEIPSALGNLSQLFALDLADNAFSVNISQGIGNLRILQYLDLSQNKLNGVIPAEVLSLSSLTLQMLNLSQNSFSGNLPTEVGKLKNINGLDVSKNSLHGPITGAIGDCLVLEYLDLSGNSFQEIIPSSLASLKGLQYLDLSRNNLSGPIPKGLQDISLLQYLNVSFNMLEGEVPTHGVFHNASAISIVGNTKLCGGISKLKLPPCPVNALKHKRQRNFKLIALISFGVATLLVVSSIFAIYHLKKRNKKPPLNSSTINQLPKVSYQTLHNATHGFSIKNLIGSGSFGSVYRGNLESEENVAVKVLNLQNKGAHKSFIAECNALRNIRHRNLVKVLTCCSGIDYNGDEFKAIVFEYMENGSLENWLYPNMEDEDHSRTFLLDQRLNIIIDVASALHYLHYECEQPIVHCDIKPSNVLLDGGMVAHVSDFGLAKLLPNKQSSTTELRGTIGYAPPEYGMGSMVSTEGDMYSFGILILEMFTGRKPTYEIFKDGHNLHNSVKTTFSDHLVQIVDPNLFPRDDEGVSTNEEESREIQTLVHVHSNVEKCLVSILNIGLACSVESPNERMSIRDVSKELDLIRKSILAGGRINRGQECQSYTCHLVLTPENPFRILKCNANSILKEIARIDDNRSKAATTRLTSAINLKLRCLLCFITSATHDGSRNSNIPPQSLLLPVTDIALALRKTPWFGTSPSNLLKETFKYSNIGKFCRPFGIGPDKLFRDRSKYRRPFNEAKDEGMISWKEFPLKLRNSKTVQSPIVSGI
ncbi:putative LRR receptor-like serine/threonine-protein kinase [Senna tora]|uniref:non-specific serine/threonine protein kinase n=1 Tax=Senna tora TaxID=362788 RepID=A0A834X0N3_9FABA|nr:putative LRR receptor-like serine/threonine-protein kinase [Senna tora]